MQTYVGKQNWKKLLAIDFHISVTKCERKFTAFASKLLQIPTKSMILTNLTCNKKHFIIDHRCLIDIAKYVLNRCPR